MATDFAVFLRRFLTGHLAGERGYSPNTIASYRDAFKLLICYFRDERHIPPERLTLEQIDAAAITGFLTWLQTSRRNSASTRNQRLAAIDSFFGWMQSQDPARMACCQDILAIPAKKQDRPAVAHLTVQQTRQLLALPDRHTRTGRRNATLLATLYDTAARVQEVADLRVRDIRLHDPAMAALTGKGRKTRHVPLDRNTAALLAAYLTERRLDSAGHEDHPVFFNQHGSKLSRGGIAWILGKYQAQATDPALSNAHLSPHILRHSRAMHLYDAGVPLPYIRDILGHVDLSTTEIYARASTEAKRKALEAAYTDVVTADLAEWNQNPELLSWLASL
ncbi:tyrosine-type recombinase/integrase [Arthrobacter gyeryongensis]|uniref:Tyrosine-type recombinase/integrase n=1 Tax=Arthrobacter gyeryongensis TaxID=1650592 RepID=A0ABP8VBG2_9MICC